MATKTFAQRALEIEKKFEGRLDPVSKRTKKSLMEDLREQQEKASGQYFTLTLKYYNSFPTPSFELIKITPPNGLIWESLPNNKFLLRMSSNKK